MMTVAGVLTEYAIPTANSFPRGITVGPDSALWFVEFPWFGLLDVYPNEYVLATANGVTWAAAAGVAWRVVELLRFDWPRSRGSASPAGR